jgi:hypothetical protein
MMMIIHALEHVGVGVRFIETIAMQFETATFCETNKDLLIEPRYLILVPVSAGLELMLIDRHPGPTEVLAFDRLDLDCLSSGIDYLVREALLVVAIIALLKPEVIVSPTG